MFDILSKFFAELFDEDSVWRGWCVYWRFQLALALLFFPLVLLSFVSDAFAVGVGAAMIVGILGGIVSWVAFQEKSLVPLRLFRIGWAVILLTVPLYIVGSFVIATVLVMIFLMLEINPLGNEVIVGIISIPLSVLYLSAVLGWSTGKVFERFKAPKVDNKSNDIPDV